ncbi:(2Fe-2S)-binding protein [Peptococcaceae bacterium 1198_IL3148]
MKRDYQLRVNGKEVTVNVSATTTLIEILRDHLQLTGTKEGCGKGECGACTVLLNGEPVNSCLVLAAQADGQDVITIEGLESDRKANKLQQAFVDVGAVQCGYCTPGMIISSKALLDKNPQPSREIIREALSGNICRCTGYTKIIDAVEKASVKALKEE